MRLAVCNLLILTAIHFIYINSAPLHNKLTLHQRLHDIVSRNKRSITSIGDFTTDSNDIYSRSSPELAESLYKTLYRQIIHSKQSVDIVILLDSSSAMGRDAFDTAEKFLARLVSMMPREKFVDGTIKVAMLTYSLSEYLTLQFGFSWDKGIYREMVRRAVKKADYQGGYENHGTTALVWAERLFSNSSRSEDNNTAKVILYATNGHLTDKDLLHSRGVADATSHVAHWLRNNGYKIFTITPGTDIDRSTISSIASEPNSDYIIPVVNSHAVESISQNIKNHIRAAHQRPSGS